MIFWLTYCAFRYDDGDPVAPPRPPKPGVPPEEIYQNISSNSPLLVRNSQLSPTHNRTNNISAHTALASDRFIFPGSSSLSAANSVNNSPAVLRRTDYVDGRVSPARNISPDALYHNTASFSSASTNGANHLSNGVSLAQTRKEIDSIYDIPKSNTIPIDTPIPTQCAGVGAQTIHKYVNASPGIVSKSRDNSNPMTLQQSSDQQVQSLLGQPIGLQQSLSHLDSSVGVVDNHYDPSPRRRPDDIPVRPPKPRILSDPTALDGLYIYLGVQWSSFGLILSINRLVLQIVCHNLHKVKFNRKTVVGCVVLCTYLFQKLCILLLLPYQSTRFY